MSILEGIDILCVRKKKYVLTYAGLKRGNKLCDILAPSGEEIYTEVPYTDAEELCQLHYVQTTPPYKRLRVVKVRKVGLGGTKRLETNNSAQTDKTNLKDYATWASEVEDESFNLNTYSRRFYESF